MFEIVKLVLIGEAVVFMLYRFPKTLPSTMKFLKQVVTGIES